MTLSSFQWLVQLSVEHALNSIPEGLLIAGVAWLILRVAGRQNSRTRFAVWFLALLAIVGLSFVPNLSSGGTMAQTVRPQVTLPGIWAISIFVLWALIATVALTRVAVGLWRLQQLRTNSVPMTASELSPSLLETVDQLRATRKMTICSSADVCGPTAIGFFKPLILLPGWVLQDLSAEELGVILLHELAHLRRWDDWTNLIQKMARTLFFFHPAVWWIEKRLSLERELACDDAVLAKTGNPQAYAACLVSLAEKGFLRRAMVLAQAAIGRAFETSLRLAHILDGNRPRATRMFKPALGVVVGFAALSLIAVAKAPVLIAFNDPRPTSVVASEIMPGSPQARVVPAMARSDSSSAFERAMTGATEPSFQRAAQPIRAVVAKKKQVQVRPVLLLRAEAMRPAPVTQFLLVVQDSEFDGHGASILSLCVWRVTVTGASAISVRGKAISKSI